MFELKMKSSLKRGLLNVCEQMKGENKLFFT